jgi:DNA-binding NarL/FixJ family response regulator
MPTASKVIRILICDDHALLRGGVATLLSAESDMNLIAEACNGEDAVEKFRMHHPDVTLMDLQMPGLSGIDAIARIRSEFPDSTEVEPRVPVRKTARKLGDLPA